MAVPGMLGIADCRRLDAGAGLEADHVGLASALVPPLAPIVTRRHRARERQRRASRSSRITSPG